MKDLKYKVARFKHAVVNGDIEKRREAEETLREALSELGLDADTINYFIAGWRRAVEVEKAYERRCEELREVRELISKAYKILF